MSMARSGGLPLVLCEYGTMTTTIWVLVSTYLPMLLHSIPLYPIPLMRPVYEQPVVTRAIDNNCSVLNSTPLSTLLLASFVFLFSRHASAQNTRSCAYSYTYKAGCNFFNLLRLISRMFPAIWLNRSHRYRMKEENRLRFIRTKNKIKSISVIYVLCWCANLSCVPLSQNYNFDIIFIFQ